MGTCPGLPRNPQIVGVKIKNAATSVKDGEVVVQETFDIFQKLPSGEPIWIKAVSGIEEAKSSLLYLSATAPGDYFIYDSRSGSILSAANDSHTRKSDG